MGHGVEVEEKLPGFPIDSQAEVILTVRVIENGAAIGPSQLGRVVVRIIGVELGRPEVLAQRDFGLIVHDAENLHLESVPESVHRSLPGGVLQSEVNHRIAAASPDHGPPERKTPRARLAVKRNSRHQRVEQLTAAVSD